MPLISANSLELYAKQILIAAGTPETAAGLVRHSLVAANLRGVDSHGVQLLPFYVQQIEAGDLNPAAEGRVVSESGCCLVYDGQNGIGQSVAETCCGHGVRIARAQGMSMVVARESNHF